MIAFTWACDRRGTRTSGEEMGFVSGSLLSMESRHCGDTKRWNCDFMQRLAREWWCITGRFEIQTLDIGRSHQAAPLVMRFDRAFTAPYSVQHVRETERNITTIVSYMYSVLQYLNGLDDILNKTKLLRSTMGCWTWWMCYIISDPVPRA